MTAFARPGLTAIGVILATCVALALAMFATQFTTAAQTDMVAQMERYSQQLNDLNRFGNSLTVPDVELRAQASIQRPGFPQRFAQIMAQLDASAAAVTRNYPDGDALRGQFTRGYADLRGKYDNALRSVGDDVTSARRNDYFVIHSDAIAQSAQSLNTVVSQLLSDDLRRMLFVGRSLSASASTIAMIWMLTGAVILGIVGFSALMVYRNARAVGQLAASLPGMEAPGEPAQREAREGRRASDLAKVQTARPVVNDGAVLLSAIDRAIPQALSQGLKTGVMHLSIMDIADLRARHSEAEIEAVQNAVGASVSAALRFSDVVAKLGEGEFGILVEEIRQRGDFPIIEQRIRRAITFAKMRLPQFGENDIQLRMGTAMYPIDGYNGEDLLLSARTAVSMQQAEQKPAEQKPATQRPVEPKQVEETPATPSPAARPSSENQPLDV
ncbi:diguanylate cyclase [Roseiarcaceae bacterium H3SJ34-1]|uniref:diguanylate cyclase domain-containing protein n=1 Tax=Terripilifer ovatus TaxID=3032367 RepID=UPI003AB947BB|nr:diguanylate cyclase [Roseiarcaceae bacterium H3SJ34-1]